MSGERLQDHWSSGLTILLPAQAQDGDSNEANITIKEHREQKQA